MMLFMAIYLELETLLAYVLCRGANVCCRFNAGKYRVRLIASQQSGQSTRELSCDTGTKRQCRRCWVWCSR